MTTLKSLETRRTNLVALAKEISARTFSSTSWDDNPESHRINVGIFIQKLKEIDAEYLTLSARIDELRLDESPEESSKQFLASQNMSMNFRFEIAKAEAQLTDISPVTKDVKFSVPEVGANACVGGSNFSIRKVTPLQIDRFNGDIFQWIPFWSRFKSRIHDDPSLSPLDKFDYLYMFISNNVKEKIKQIFVSSENYVVAVELLKNEYGRHDKLMDAYCQRLNDLPRVKSEYDISGLRNLTLSVKSSIAALNSVGVDTTSISSLFFTKFKSCVPQKLLLEFLIQSQRESNPVLESTSVTSTMESQEANLLSLIQFIENRIVQLDSIDLVEVERFKTNQFSSSRSVPTLRGFSTTAHSTSRSFSTNSNNNFQNSGNINHMDRKNFKQKTFNLLTQCIFCKNSEHDSAKCNAKFSVSQRRDIMKKARCCYKCLQTNHFANRCNVRLECEVCQGRHLSILCETRLVDARCCNTTLESASKCFKTLLAVAIGPRGERQDVRILLDSGSQNSFVTEKFAQKLGFRLESMKKQNVTLRMLDGQSSSKSVCKVELRLQRSDGKGIHHWLGCLSLDEICSESFTPSMDNETKELLRSQDIEICDKEESKLPIDILIGLDHLVEFETHEAVRLTRTLEAVNTVLGWTLFGTKDRSEGVGIVQCSHVSRQNSSLGPDDDLNCAFGKFIESEALVLDSEPRTSVSSFVDSYKELIVLKNSRFHVPLPLREGCVAGPNNLLCRARLTSLNKRLEKFKLAEQYEREFDDLLKNGIIEKVDAHVDTSKLNFLPHREVIKQESLTTKLRIVFDASAKQVGSLSLNDVVEHCPDLINNMLGVILNFRKNQIVVQADIEKAFVQIVIEPEHRNLLCLYLKSKSDSEFRIFRLTRIYFGIHCSPFILAICLEKLFADNEAQFSDTVKLIRGGIYVDDVAVSVKTEADAERFFYESREILGQASFNLRKWTSNSPSLCRLARQHGVSIEEHGISSSDVTNLLGIVYDRTSDTLALNMKPFLTASKEALPLTKRKVLSIVSSIFDPMGVAAPIVVGGKQILQKIWSIGIKWDDEIPKEIGVEFVSWMTDVSDLGKLRLNRLYDGTGSLDCTSEVSLHIFGDASALAFGAVAYVVSTNRELVTSCSFLMSRSRVAPLRNSTIPRLELMALVLATEIMEYVLTHLSVSFRDIFLWSDSSVVVQQVNSKNPQKYSTFVRNRTAKIHARVKDIAVIRHVPGSLNPADIVSRGCTVEELRLSRWLTGAEFLTGSRDDWPRDCFPEQTIEVAKAEVVVDVKALIDFARFRSLKQLKRTLVHVRRFGSRRSGSAIKRGPIEVLELDECELILVKMIQAEMFGDELKSLLGARAVSATSSIFSLNPVLDSSACISVGGRLEMAQGSISRNPVILPTKHIFTSLLIREVHENHSHCGVIQTLSHIRERFWIPSARRVIKSIIFKCPKCVRFHAKSSSQTTGNPPEWRLSRARPFQNVGLDFCGPFYIRSDLLDSPPRKVYVCLYTCSTTRAVHLELTESLTVRDFLLSFRRFKARRGVPAIIYSDNAKTFQQSAKDVEELSSLLLSSDLHEEAAYQGVQWKFGVPNAPWRNGFVERLVKNIKDAMKRVIGRETLNYQEFMTVVYEIEDTVNRRPLVQLIDDPTVKVLTPMDFILQEAPLGLNESHLPYKDRRTELIKRWRNRKHVVEQFWLRWEAEYLGQLRDLHGKTKGSGEPPKIDEVVIIKEDRTSRLFWRMGRVCELHMGRDGKTRSCTLRLSNGRIVRRPLEHVYKLEIC